MLRALKRLFDIGEENRSLPEFERRQLHLAVATLLHESTRVDLNERPDEYAAAQRALGSLFSLTESECVALLAEARGKARQLTSYFGPVSAIKRDFSLPERVIFVEHLWRVAYADGALDPYEDHYVRKIAHLLYVPNTQCMLARGRAAKHRGDAE